MSRNRRTTNPDYTERERERENRKSCVRIYLAVHVFKQHRSIAVLAVLVAKLLSMHKPILAADLHRCREDAVAKVCQMQLF